MDTSRDSRSEGLVSSLDESLFLTCRNIVRAYGDVHVSPGICSWPAVSGGRVTGQGSRGQLNHKVAACLLLYLRIVSITDITVEIDAAVSRFITDQ